MLSSFLTFFLACLLFPWLSFSLLCCLSILLLQKTCSMKRPSASSGLLSSSSIDSPSQFGNSRQSPRRQRSPFTPRNRSFAVPYEKRSLVFPGQRPDIVVCGFPPEKRAFVLDMLKNNYDVGSDNIIATGPNCAYIVIRPASQKASLSLMSLHGTRFKPRDSLEFFLGVFETRDFAEAQPIGSGSAEESPDGGEDLRLSNSTIEGPFGQSEIGVIEEKGKKERTPARRTKTMSAVQTTSAPRAQEQPESQSTAALAQTSTSTSSWSSRLLFVHQNVASAFPPCDDAFL